VVAVLELGEWRVGVVAAAVAVAAGLLIIVLGGQPRIVQGLLLVGLLCAVVVVLADR
jgi:hypothetical protein